MLQKHRDGHIVMTELVEVAGLKVYATSINSATNLVMDSARGSDTTFHLVNAYSVSIAHRDKNYRNLLTQGVLFPDGKPLAILAKRKNVIASQIRGPSLFEKALQDKCQDGVKHFFLGSTYQVLDKITKRAKSENKYIKVVGSYSPPFGYESKDQVRHQDEIILESGANLVWVGLGTPKQDFEAARISREIGITAVAIGAAFDFYAGTKREAPNWLRNLGLEWFFRLFTEPRRLWKRYFFGNLIFIFAVIRSLLKR